jgi:flagellar motor switch protein FliN/FliY
MADVTETDEVVATNGEIDIDPPTEMNVDDGKNINALLNVKLDVRVVLGHSKMQISDLLELTRGSVIELDQKVGAPVDIMVNDRTVARGDLVKINGDSIGVALREVVKDFVQSH